MSEKVYLAADASRLSDNALICIPVEEAVEYLEFADDFGPMNLTSIFLLCGSLDGQLRTDGSKKIALISRSDPRSLTNSVFLVGAS